MHVKSFEWGALSDSHLASPSRAWPYSGIVPSLAPQAFYLPSKRKLLIAMGMTQNLLNPCGNNVKRGHKGKILIKSQKCGSRRFPKERPVQKEKANTCSVNKKPQMCSKEIPRRKTGQTEEAHMFVGVSCCRNCVCLLRRRRLRACALCSRARGGLAESYLAWKRALAVGCEHFAVRSQMSTAFSLSFVHQGFTKLLQKLACPLGGGEE
jgi:hypothetical protein